MRQKIHAIIAQRRQRGKINKMRIMAIPFALVTVMLLAVVAFAASMSAGAPVIQVEVIPNSLEIPSQGEVEVLVIARNPVTDVLRDVQLSYFAYTGVSVTVESPPSDTFAPYGALAWTLRLSQAGNEPVTGTIHLRIDYTWQGKDQAEAVPCVAHSSFQVKTRETETAAEIVEVTIKTVSETLMEYRPSIIYLVAKNKSNVSIQVTSVSARGPEGITFILPTLEDKMTLIPGETHAFPVEVEMTGSVWSGKHLLVFELGFEWEKASRASTGNTVVTHEVDIGVLGESGILTVLGLTAVGVPSFLVLPGLLMVMTAKLLHVRLFKRGQNFPLPEIQDRTKPEFWFVIITLSLPTALLYPVVTRLLVVIGLLDGPRNLLRGYGISDVIAVWIASIILAAAAYIGVTGFVSLTGDIKRQRLTPEPGEKPIPILRKLDRQGLGVWRDRVAAKVEGELLKYVYLLKPETEGQQTIWVGPRIAVRWTPGAESKLRKKVEAQINSKGERDAGVVANLLEEAVSKEEKIVWVEWERKGELTGPCQVKIEDVQKKEGEEDIKPNSIVFIEDFINEEV